MRKLWIDVETRARVDLKKTGVYRYVEDPDHRILMAAWTDDKVNMHVALGEDEIRRIPGLFDPGVMKVAANAAFERINFSRLQGLPTGTYLPPKTYDDPMVRASEYGYPRGLDAAAKALGTTQKSGAGTRLISLFSKPNRKGEFNDAETHPEEWQEFINYCRQDVWTLVEIDEAIPDWPVNERERWIASEIVNDTGLPVDVKMAQAAEAVGLENGRKAKQRAIEISGMANPGSPIQMGQWLMEQGVPLPNLQAKTVEATLEQDDLPANVREVLELRQEMALIAAKKYTAALGSVCSDGRLRGSFMFFGAHTGRWSGKGAQPQNMPNASLGPKDASFEEIEDLIAASVLDLRLGNGASPQELKALVRNMFIGPFTVVDYAAIEARVIAWLAGEEWALDAFRRGRDIYVETAERMGGLTRKEGKVACIAKNSKVLTHQGMVEIENVTTDHLVWDGEEWVSHDGLIYRGVKDVIEYQGLTATADHLVWVEGQTEPVRFDLAAASGSRLVQSGAGREALRVGHDYQPRAEVPEGLVRDVRAYSVQRVRGRAVAVFDQPDDRKVQGVPDVQPTPAGAQVAGPEIDGRSDAVPESGRSPLAPVWGEGDRVPVPVHSGGWAVGHGEYRTAGSGYGAGPDRQQRALRPRELEVGYSETERDQPGDIEAVRVDPRELALRGTHGPEKAVGRENPRPDSPGSSAGRGGEAEGVAYYRGSVAVYDLLNAGSRHRFTVSNALVSNCLALGYAGGKGSLKVMGAQGSDAELQFLVDQWRAANPNIVRFWNQLEEAFWYGDRPAGPHVFVEKHGHDRHVRLPSGRAIVYRRVSKEWIPVGKDGDTKLSITFADPKGWRTGTYSGKIAENCLAADTEVLTDRGWVKIVAVDQLDTLWDGVEWVNHSGLLYSGVQQTLSVDGVRMTADHRLLTTKGWQHASSSEGSHRAAVQLPHGSAVCGVHREEVDVAGPLRVWQRGRKGGQRTAETEAQVLRLHEREADLRVENDPRHDGAPSVLGLALDDRPVPATNAPGVEKLRGAWDHGVQAVGNLRGLLGRYGALVCGRSNAGEGGQRVRVLPGELPLGDMDRTGAEPAGLPSDPYASRRDGTDGGESGVRDRLHDAAVPAGERVPARPVTLSPGREEPVYDLTNAGPRSRFVVRDSSGEPMIVHNCTQAVARDILADAIVRLVRAKYEVVGHVHDEVIVKGGTLEEINRIMLEPPAWSGGLPIDGEGFSCQRYRKD